MYVFFVHKISIDLHDVACDFFIMYMYMVLLDFLDFINNMLGSFAFCS